jgi:ornithine cyclodeaminase
MRVLTDADLTDPHLMQRSIACMTRAFADHENGEMISPPRVNVPFKDRGNITFTVGGSLGASSAAGFRAYESFGPDNATRTHVIVVWDIETGVMEGVVLGDRLGKLRMGAIGALAIDRMARRDCENVAVLGTGLHARAQLEGAAAVRGLKKVRVFSRSADNRKNFAEAMMEVTGIEIEPIDSARTAVEGADLIITATTAGEPVIEADWVASGAHINTIGTKNVKRHELPINLGARASVIATDSLDQIAAMNPAFFLSGTEAGTRILSLPSILAGKQKGRISESDVTLFCSGGLAGTEVLLAAELLRC